MLNILTIALSGLLLLANIEKDMPAHQSVSIDSNLTLRDQLKISIENCKNGIDLTAVRDHLHGKDLLYCLGLECEIFKTYGDVVRSGQESDDHENKVLAAELKNRLIAIQIKELPTMRVAYMRAMSELLKKTDSKIKLSNKTKTFNFTCSKLNSEYDRYKIHAVCFEVLLSLRFTQANYKQYKTDKPSCYTIDSQGDFELY